MHVFMHDVHERVFCVYDMYVLVCVWGECIYGCICIFVYVYMWCMCVWVCLCVSVLYMDDVCVCVCYVIWHIWEEDNIQLSFPFVALLRQGQHKASPCCPDITSHHWKASLSSIVQAILLINLDIRLQSACCLSSFEFAFSCPDYPTSNSDHCLDCYGNWLKGILDFFLTPY